MPLKYQSIKHSLIDSCFPTNEYVPLPNSIENARAFLNIIIWSVLCFEIMSRGDSPCILDFFLILVITSCRRTVNYCVDWKFAFVNKTILLVYEEGASNCHCLELYLTAKDKLLRGKKSAAAEHCWLLCPCFLLVCPLKRKNNILIILHIGLSKIEPFFPRKLSCAPPLYIRFPFP